MLKNKYKIKTCLSCDEAIETIKIKLKFTKKCTLCNNKNFSLIFMDIDMPLKDGFQTTKEILQLYK